MGNHRSFTIHGSWTAYELRQWTKCALAAPLSVDGFRDLKRWVTPPEPPSAYQGKVRVQRLWSLLRLGDLVASEVGAARAGARQLFPQIELRLATTANRSEPNSVFDSAFKLKKEEKEENGYFS